MMVFCIFVSSFNSRERKFLTWNLHESLVFFYPSYFLHFSRSCVWPWILIWFFGFTFHTYCWSIDVRIHFTEVPQRKSNNSISVAFPCLNMFLYTFQLWTHINTSISDKRKSSTSKYKINKKIKDEEDRHSAPCYEMCLIWKFEY